MVQIVRQVHRRVLAVLGSDAVCEVQVFTELHALSTGCLCVAPLLVLTDRCLWRYQRVHHYYLPPLVHFGY